jgi:hypothetical protein
MLNSAPLHEDLLRILTERRLRNCTAGSIAIGTSEHHTSGIILYKRPIIIDKWLFVTWVLQLLVTAKVAPSWPILTLVTEAKSSFEMSVLRRPTRRKIPDDGILHSHRHENLYSLGPVWFFYDAVIKNISARHSRKIADSAERNVWKCFPAIFIGLTNYQNLITELRGITLMIIFTIVTDHTYIFIIYLSSLCLFICHLEN